MDTDLQLEEILSECFPKDVPIKCIDYKGIFVPETYPRIADSIENFEVRDDDIWVCSFPKTGTTWTQEMVWCIGNDLNFEAAKKPMALRFPFVEFTGTTTFGWVTFNKPSDKYPEHASNSVEYAAKLPSPRFLKTHLPFNLLPRQLRTREKKNKIIYVARNPKDTCISYYNHYKLLEAYCGTFENFCKLFLGGKVYFAPFWDHIISYWNNKNDENLLFLRYEDMKKDLSSVIKKTATFLGKNLNGQQVRDLEAHLSFASMKANPAINMELVIEWMYNNKVFGDQFTMDGDGKFIRKGEVDQWKTNMSKELIKQFDVWTDKKLKNLEKLKDQFS